MGGTSDWGLQAVFLDRDGTIGGDGHFVHPRDFRPFTGALECIQSLRRAGLKVFAFTQQHRIGLRQATMDEFYEEFRSYGMDEAYICPHTTSEACDCRKPSPGLLLRAAEQHGLDLSRCVVIGDTNNDMMAAVAVGAKNVLVKTGWGHSSLTSHRYLWAHVDPDYIADSIVDATEWVLALNSQGGGQ